MMGEEKNSTNPTKTGRIEKELQESQAQLAGIIASAMDAIISVDESQHIVLFNAAAEQMFRCPADEAIGQPLDRFIPERFREVHRQHIRRFGQAGVTNRKMGHLGTLWALRANSQEFPIEASISQVKAGGERLYTVILRDITEELRIEEELRQSEERYRSVVEDMPGLLCRFRPGGILEFVNEAYARTLGCKPEELIGRSFLSFIPKRNREAVQAGLDALSPESPVMTHEHPVIVAGGDVRWQRWTNRLLTDDAGRTVAYQAFGLDVTERKQAAEELRRSEANLRAILNNTLQAFFLLDRDSRVRAANRVANNWITQIQGQPLRSISFRPTFHASNK